MFKFISSRKLATVFGAMAIKLSPEYPVSRLSWPLVSLSQTRVGWSPSVPPVSHSFPVMSPTYSHIVVGAGISGSWAAAHLARRGTAVLLIDQVNCTAISLII